MMTLRSTFLIFLSTLSLSTLNAVFLNVTALANEFEIHVPDGFEEGTETRLSSTQLEEIRLWAYQVAFEIPALLRQVKNQDPATAKITLLTGIKNLVELSGTKKTETLIRYILNRGLKVIYEIDREADLKAPGSLAAEVTFLKSSLKLSAEFASQIQKPVEMGKFGLEYAQFLIRLNSTVTHNASAQYRIGLTALGLLNWDLYRDIDHRHLFAPLIEKIRVFLQQHPLNSAEMDSVKIEHYRKVCGLFLEITELNEKWMLGKSEKTRPRSDTVTIPLNDKRISTLKTKRDVATTLFRQSILGNGTTYILPALKRLRSYYDSQDALTSADHYFIHSDTPFSWQNDQQETTHTYHVWQTDGCVETNRRSDTQPLTLFYDFKKRDSVTLLGLEAETTLDLKGDYVPIATVGYASATNNGSDHMIPLNLFYDRINDEYFSTTQYEFPIPEHHYEFVNTVAWIYPALACDTEMQDQVKKDAPPRGSVLLQGPPAPERFNVTVSYPFAEKSIDLQVEYNLGKLEGFYVPMQIKVRMSLEDSSKLDVRSYRMTLMRLAKLGIPLGVILDVFSPYFQKYDRGFGTVFGFELARISIDQTIGTLKDGGLEIYFKLSAGVGSSTVDLSEKVAGFQENSFSGKGNASLGMRFAKFISLEINALGEHHPLEQVNAGTYSYKVHQFKHSWGAQASLDLPADFQLRTILSRDYYNIATQEGEQSESVTASTVFLKWGWK